MRISVSGDFSEVPAGRYRTDGPFSGEEFRETCLVPALRSGDRVEVDLDGTEGYGSSFLEEAFGGLIRERYFSLDDLQLRLRIHSTDPTYTKEIMAYMRAANEHR